MEHTKQVEILKALMQQLDEEKISMLASSIATKPRRMFVLTGLLKKRKNFSKTTLNSLVYLEICQKKAVI